jgi:hypothetical protein
MNTPRYSEAKRTCLDILNLDKHIWIFWGGSSPMVRRLGFWPLAEGMLQNIQATAKNIQAMLGYSNEGADLSQQSRAQAWHFWRATTPLLATSLPILAHWKLGFIPYLSPPSFVLHDFGRLSALCGCAWEVEDPPSPPPLPLLSLSSLVLIWVRDWVS